MNNPEDKIYDALMSQRFVDWYDHTFVPLYVEGGEAGADDSPEAAKKEIRDIFDL